MPIETVQVLGKTEIVTMRPGWPGCARLHQSVIAPFSCASRTYSDSGRSAYADLFAQLASTYHQLVHTLRAVRGEPVVSLGLHRHGMLH